ncbi:MAG: DUF349 domain-containing protein, partial [Bacteroidales bacterium]|nr:DUF349 domain-containing protein [Bacteroidales bacterium]
MEENKDLHNQNPEANQHNDREENTQDSNVSGSQEQEENTQNPQQQENQESSSDLDQEGQASSQESEQKTESTSPEGEEQQESGQEKNEQPVQDNNEQPVQEKGEQSESGGEEQTASGTEESDNHSEEQQQESAESTAKKKSGDEHDSIEHHEDEDIYGHEERVEKSEEEEEEELDEQTFHNMSREELLAQLEEAVQAENINKVKNKISLIKVAFVRKTKDKKQQDYEQFVEKGSEDEEFVEQQDDLEKRFNEVFDVYRQKKAEYNRKQEELKQQNLEKKKAILERLRELINSDESLKKTYDEFKELQRQWKNIGLVPRGEVNELWKNYHFLVEKFFDKVKINKELRDLGLKKNLQKKVELCESAEELLLEDDVNKAFKLLQKYHQRWKEIGPVPREYNESIWQRFKSATDKINERRREFYRQQAEKREENYKAKLALCEKAEALVAQENKTVKDWLDNTDKMNEL